MSPSQSLCDETCTPRHPLKFSHQSRTSRSQDPQEPSTAQSALLAHIQRSNTASYSSFPAVEESSGDSSPTSSFDSFQFYVQRHASHNVSSSPWNRPIQSLRQLLGRFVVPSSADCSPLSAEFKTIDWMSVDKEMLENRCRLSRARGIRGHLQRSRGACVLGLRLLGMVLSIALMAYIIDTLEPWLFDAKFGYCSTSWLKTIESCCNGASHCPQWLSWGGAVSSHRVPADLISFVGYVLMTVVLASVSAVITAQVKLEMRPNSLSQGAADNHYSRDAEFHHTRKWNSLDNIHWLENVVFPAAGSGVVELRLILSGFVLEGYLSLKVLVAKMAALVLSVASGLAIGKEGPYVHMSAAIAASVSRISPSIIQAHHHEILRIGVACGIAVAFGAPIAGMVFVFEDFDHRLARQLLFHMLSCCVLVAACLELTTGSALGSHFLGALQSVPNYNPTLLLLGSYFILGICGGSAGALLIKMARAWASYIRRSFLARFSSLSDVILISILNGVTTYWITYTRQRPIKLLQDLATPCQIVENTRQCSRSDGVSLEIEELAVSLVLKLVLTAITQGLRVPGGIYIPSMVLGGLFGRLVGMILLRFASASSSISHVFKMDSFAQVSVDPAVFALIGAAATLCGVTRLTVTTLVLLTEMSGSIAYAIPLTAAIAGSRFAADLIEPYSIYDQLTEANNYPSLREEIACNKAMDGTVADVVLQMPAFRQLEVSGSGLVESSFLRAWVDSIKHAGGTDFSLAILRDGNLVGLSSISRLAAALGKIPERCEGIMETHCLLAEDVNGDIDGGRVDRPSTVKDFRDLVDSSPVCLDINCDLRVMYGLFAKLGMREICVTSNTQLYGIVHRLEFASALRGKTIG